MRNLENQVGQLATALNSKPAGSLPSDTEVPKIQGREEVKMIELRSGRNLEPLIATRQPTVTTDQKAEKFKEVLGSTEQPLEDEQLQAELDLGPRTASEEQGQ